jgi:hypothetical protein
VEPELLSPLITGPFRDVIREGSENLKATALRTVKIYSIARRQAAAAQWQASTGSQKLRQPSGWRCFLFVQIAVNGIWTHGHRSRMQWGLSKTRCDFAVREVSPPFRFT